MFYYFSDHLKTASVITDSAGVIKAESDYYPWGGELQFVANDSNHYKFTSKERDGETGLDYFGARYYSNGLGRWVSADWSATPIPVPYADFHDPQSLNLYGYVGGNPASKADPDGHEDPPSPSVWQIIKVGVPIVAEILAHELDPRQLGNPDPNSISGQMLKNLAESCTCRTPDNTSNNKSNNNNNSQSSNTAEQGRDAQGKFTSKQPGQSAPGAAAEKEGLDSVGAVKNTEKLNGTVRDGTIPETEQHVEVKSGASVSNTGQLRSMGQTAVDATSKPLKVVTTNPNVKVSGPAQKNPNLEIQPAKKP
ncbi:MAG TPA: RHS repeat-associated core domain-containing protein [Verrucomicrobiae bacterium]|nr:RHS repeat-associated core domain-containing protein [Verrucomicrobiae bacterium]